MLHQHPCAREMARAARLPTRHPRTLSPCSYCHVGHAVVVKPGGEVELQRDSSEAPLEGTAVPEVLPAVGAAVGATVAGAVAGAVPRLMQSAGAEIAAAVAGDSDGEGGGGGGSSSSSAGSGGAPAALSPDQLSLLWEAEKEAWSALLGGGALEDHTEEFYYDSLEAAVDRLLGQQEAGGGGQEEAAAAPPPSGKDATPAA